MREIKFRVWDKDKNIRHDLFLCKGKWYDIYEDYGGLFSSGLVRERLHNAIAQQFTGLYDVDGKDIYEGDIVEHPMYGEEGGNLAHYEVKFYWACFLLDSLDGTHGGIRLHQPCKQLYTKVIGNIFENREGKNNG